MKTKRLMAFIILLVVATKFKVFILDKVYAAQNNNKNQNDKQMIKNIEDIKNNIDNLTKTKFVEEVDANELKKNFDNKLKMNKYVFKNGQIFYCNVLPHMTTTSDVNFFAAKILDFT